MEMEITIIHRSPDDLSRNLREQEEFDCLFIDLYSQKNQAIDLLKNLVLLHNSIPIIILQPEHHNLCINLEVNLNIIDYLTLETISLNNLCKIINSALYFSKLKQKFALKDRQHINQIQVIQRLTDLFNRRGLTLIEVMGLMGREICQAIPDAETCFIIFYNLVCPNKNFAAVTTGIQEDKIVLEDTIAFQRGLFHKVFITGEAILSVEEHLQFDRPKILPQTIYAVPIKSISLESLGVLAIGNWQKINNFLPQDKELLVAIAKQTANATEMIRLIKALADREDRLKDRNQILYQQNQQLEKQRQQIEQQNLQLRELAETKSQCLITMSHELRTPISAIVNFSQLLARKYDNILNHDILKIIERILSNGKNLLSLIDDLLYLSKIEAKQLKLNPKKFNLINLVAIAIEELRSLAEEKNLVFQYTTNLPSCYIINDYDRLKQILINLIGNAIKFTENGSVNIIILQKVPNLVRLEVIDTGIGIPEKHLESIFEDFRQVDRGTNRKYSGTGLGLAIVKSLVELMEGKVTVQSQIDKGSVFAVEFPQELSLQEKTFQKITNS
jgi:signal transduction histidine kinase